MKQIPLPEIVPDLCLSFLDNIIAMENIVLEKELGKGSYAVVYKGETLHRCRRSTLTLKIGVYNSETVAVKQYKMGGGWEDDENSTGSRGEISTIYNDDHLNSCEFSLKFRRDKRRE